MTWENIKISKVNENKIHVSYLPKPEMYYNHQLTHVYSGSYVAFYPLVSFQQTQ